VTFPKQRLCGKEKDISVLGWKELVLKDIAEQNNNPTIDFKLPI